MSACTLHDRYIYRSRYIACRVEGHRVRVHVRAVRIGDLIEDAILSSTGASWDERNVSLSPRGQWWWEAVVVVAVVVEAVVEEAVVEAG